MTGGRIVAQAAEAFIASGKPAALKQARRAFMREHGKVFWILGIMQYFWYSSDKRRERFVAMCADPDVQELTWQAYMNKRLVRAKPLAHARIFRQGHGASAGIETRHSMTKNWILPVLVAVIVAAGVAFLGATITDLGPWYQALEKPSWTPPDPVFGIAWTIIFSLTAWAAVTAWRQTPNVRASDTLIGLFALNGFLNILWSLTFFRMQRPDLAFAELLLLWLSVLALIVVCWRRSPFAGMLLVPYLVWVTIAGALNWQVVELNGPFG